MDLGCVPQRSQDKVKAALREQKDTPNNGFVGQC